MTTPIVTEIPLQLEPATADSFLEPEPGRAQVAPVIRELDHRRSDGIDVRLLWSPGDDRIVVTVADGKTGERFAITVAPHEAVTAFHHPYAYGASNNAVHQTAGLNA